MVCRRGFFLCVRDGGGLLNGDLDARCIKAPPIAQIVIHFNVNSDSLRRLKNVREANVTKSERGRIIILVKTLKYNYYLILIT